MTEAVDCLSVALRYRMKQREEIPQPSPVEKNQVAITPEPNTALKVAIYSAMREQSMMEAGLAPT